tara:strand:- start:85173 stop:86630 length:1458 start_codon:yes stop_codon:yes gene_type:complete
MYKNLISSKKNILLLSLFAFFMCLPLVSNLFKASLAFINAADFGIYQKAILEIAHGPDWNPYVTITDLKILNDHFDPAIYIAAAFTKIFNVRLYGFIVFEWLWYLAASALIVFTSKSTKQLFIGLLLFVFSRGLLEAIEFPIHPTTWSVFPAMLFIYFIHTKKYAAAFTTALALATFREIYFFMFAGAAAWFFLQKNWKQMALYLALSVTLIAFLLFVRPMLFGGPIAQYSHAAKSQGFIGLASAFINFKYPWKVFLPLIIAMLLIIRSSKFKFLNQTTCFALLFTLPGILIHIVSGRMVHHHAVPFVAPLIMALHMDNIASLLKSKKVIWGFIILSIVVASSRHTKMIKYFVDSSSYYRTNVEEKNKSLHELKEVFALLDENSTILSTGGVIPYLQKASLKLYHYSNLTPKNLTPDYIILERNGIGDPFPLSYEQLEKAINCLSSNERILAIMSNKHFLIFSGAEIKDCLRLRENWPNIVIPVQ